ncbi:RWD domain-containing protein [Cryptosporidium felis]|nr:RWD domain-containing protein [Cryptosporidium felis]
MDDLNLELEALQAIYSEKELSIETTDSQKTTINIQFVKELNGGDFQLNNNGSLKFIKINISLVLGSDYPKSAPPEIESVCICTIDGEYSMSESPTENDIKFDESSCTFINTDEVFNYYNSIKYSFLGRVCIFDVIESLQVHIDETVSTRVLKNDTLEAGTKCGDLATDDKEDQEDEIVFSGLTERHLCPIEERVTEEEFNLWKTQFKDEMVEKGIWRSEKADLSSLTGKQLFEKDESLIKSDYHVLAEVDPI